MSTLTLWNAFRHSDDLRRWRARDRWNPVREIENLHARMDQLMASWPDGEEAMTVSDGSPLVDILKQNGEYLLKAEVPEVKKEDLKVRVEDGTLQIVGERKSEKEEKGRKFHRIERSYGSFERVSRCRRMWTPRRCPRTSGTASCKSTCRRPRLPRRGPSK
jgi:HSP20 family protein